MIRFATPRTALALGMMAALGGAGAQTTPPAKPAQPAAAPAQGKTATLGGGPGKGNLLTRSELRVCLQQQQALTTRRVDIEASQVKLQSERGQLLREQEGLNAERAKVESVKQAAADLNVRYQAYSERVEAWNKRVKDSQERLTVSDRERKDIEREQAELQKQQTELEAERTKVGEDAQTVVSEYNAHAAAIGQRSADWNMRSAALTDTSNTLNAERESWAIDCADRRYREDDETAIRRGQ